MELELRRRRFGRAVRLEVAGTMSEESRELLIRELQLEPEDVLRTQDGVRHYFHVGTGNYNPRTARTYVDLGLLSADPDIGADLGGLFNYEASQAGTKIDLVVRGICCLRPGIPGMSEGIRVRSLVGRFLEHSRIFAFGVRERRCYYIGSADLMPRNLDRRVEALVPVGDPALQARLQEVLDLNLSDDTLAWELNGDGTWHKVPTGNGVNAQNRLQEITLQRSRRPIEPSVPYGH